MNSRGRIIIEARERAAKAEPVTLEKLDLTRAIVERIRVDPETKCWVWIGSCRCAGQPVISMASMPRSTSVKAFIWAAAHGLLPPGTQLQRKCGNRECVSPNHGHMTPLGANERRGSRLPGIAHNMTFLGIPLREMIREDAIDHARRRDELERNGFDPRLMVQPTWR